MMLGSSIIPDSIHLRGTMRVWANGVDPDFHQTSSPWGEDILQGPHA